MDVEHATKLAEAFNAQNLTSAVIHGALPKEKRKQLLKDFHDGKIRVLTNCQVLTEGWDEPKVNCIAHGQRVLTDQGLVPIEDVTRDMKVWDGEEWVTHDGVVYQGERYTMTYAGLTATPDHKVFSEAGWIPLQHCVKKGLRIAITGDGEYPVQLYAHKDLIGRANSFVTRLFLYDQSSQSIKAPASNSGDVGR